MSRISPRTRRAFAPLNDSGMVSSSFVYSAFESGIVGGSSTLMADSLGIRSSQPESWQNRRNRRTRACTCWRVAEDGYVPSQVSRYWTSSSSSISAGKNFERDSKKVFSRSSSRSYFLSTPPFKPSCRFSIRNSSTARDMVLRSSVTAVGFPPASKPASSLRRSRSACSHDRVLADRRNCLPSWVQRRCLRQLQRLQRSSSRYLQSGLCRTKISIEGALIVPVSISNVWRLNQP